jgi:hypothetical protein
LRNFKNVSFESVFYNDVFSFVLSDVKLGCAMLSTVLKCVYNEEGSGI